MRAKYVSIFLATFIFNNLTCLIAQKKKIDMFNMN